MLHSNSLGTPQRRSSVAQQIDSFPFASIWKSFVPFHSYQVFQRGAYYSVEVIPDSLAVISLNTMYFFDSNKGSSYHTLCPWLGLLTVSPVMDSPIQFTYSP